VFCYDFPSDKAGNRRRAKIVKILEGHGNRAQYSVFELRFSKEEELEKLLKKMEKMMNLKEDSLRIYPLDSITEKKIRILGTGEVFKREDVYVF
jgi:CRISPR-associated protein Cas2